MLIQKTLQSLYILMDGALKALAGITTLDEVNRVASDLA